MKYLGKLILCIIEAIMVCVVSKLLSIEWAILIVLVQIYLEMTFGDNNE